MANVKVDQSTAEALLGLATADPTFLETMLAMQIENMESSGLDARSYSLCKIAALIALDAPPASFVAQISFALAAGATPQDIVGVLKAVAPQVGMPKVIAAAPEIMLALGLNLPEEETHASAA